MKRLATKLAAGLVLASGGHLVAARAATEVTPLNCSPSGPSTAANATPPTTITYIGGNPYDTVTLLEPAAPAGTPRVYLLLQTLGGIVYVTADGTSPVSGTPPNTVSLNSGSYILQQGGDRIGWSNLNGAGQNIVPQGAIYAIGTSTQPQQITCKVYPG